MKKTITRKVIVIPSIIALAGAGVLLSSIFQSSNGANTEVSPAIAVVEQQPVPEQDVPQKATVIDTDDISTETEVPVTPEVEVIVPQTILSVQEYADMYLDFSWENSKACLDLIIEMYPIAFTEQNREKTIKALAPTRHDFLCGTQRIKSYIGADGKTYRVFEGMGTTGEWLYKS